MREAGERGLPAVAAGGGAIHGYVGRRLQRVTAQGTWRLHRVRAS
jgi:hypothetical protein